jgi:serine protease Do
VLAVGYPASSDMATDASMTATFKDGRISSKKTREGGLLPVYEVSAAMSPGMSGGPTVTIDGEVVGLNSFYPAGENQQFNFLSPVSLIRETLTRTGPVAVPAAAATSGFCGQCGQHVPAEHRFCPDCGAGQHPRHARPAVV